MNRALIKTCSGVLTSIVVGLSFMPVSGSALANENLDKIAALQQGQISTILERMDKSWKPCGSIKSFANLCEIPSFPVKDYEYGIAYNSIEPMSVACVRWNVGHKLHNREPYMTATDNPSTVGSMKWGGFMFYTGTAAADDDTCTGGTWRHHYWQIDDKGGILLGGSNGCSDAPIFCRRR